MGILALFSPFNYLKYHKAVYQLRENRTHYYSSYQTVITKERGFNPIPYWITGNIIFYTCQVIIGNWLENRTKRMICSQPPKGAPQRSVSPAS
jgi:hypothetical protein